MDVGRREPSGSPVDRRCRTSQERRARRGIGVLSGSDPPQSDRKSAARITTTDRDDHRRRRKNVPSRSHAGDEHVVRQTMNDMKPRKRIEYTIEW